MPYFQIPSSLISVTHIYFWICPLLWRVLYPWGSYLFEGLGYPHPDTINCLDKVLLIWEWDFIPPSHFGAGTLILLNLWRSYIWYLSYCEFIARSPQSGIMKQEELNRRVIRTREQRMDGRGIANQKTFQKSYGNLLWKFPIIHTYNVQRISGIEI